MAAEVSTYHRRAEINGEHLITPQLQRQMDVYFGLLPTIFLPEGADELQLKGLGETVGTLRNIITSRNIRAQEVQMDEVKEAAEIANSLYRNPIFQELCIDGRVLPALVGGFSAGIGGSIRTPAGDLKEVVKDKSGGVKIMEGSTIDVMLDEAFQKSDVISELLDSHLGCAARGTGEANKGRRTTDDGLLKDVKRKKDIATAMKKHVKNKYGDTKRVNTIQFSFDPHNGYGYMGLETEEALKEGEKMKGFDQSTCKRLRLERKIISTHELSYETVIKQAFDEHLFSPDWKDKYPETAYLFWTNVQEMQETVLPHIEERVRLIYKESISDDEIHDRALLLLTNAYSGYLHNYDQIYPYHDHVEAGVNITVGMYGPHPESLFAVNDQDIDNLPGSTSFAAQIVRANRRAGRVKSALLTQDEFVAAPVPLVIAETVKIPDTLSTIGTMDFSDLPQREWLTMTDYAFTNYLIEKNPQISAVEVRALNNLREKMVRLYTQRVSTSEELINGELIPLPVITDKNREIKAIIPFFLMGY